jgi:NAD(P)-dependent dehydrogenase (short-subunit alcohol dehydrogenase family)
MFELTGKTALVTGAAKRIGNAISAGLAKQGVNVIIHYGRSESEARKL